MDAQIISGKEISEQIREELREKVAYLKDRGITPGLGVVLVGEDPASKIYVNNKIKACEDLGLKSKAVILPAEVTEDELLKKVDELNADPEIHAFLVQLP
ncbi:tetrahydrofolate dehydrogenase/cyclohydrolase catalytic domain-containing protein, partial [Candidatus Methanomassiliicoccus intestinalis]